MQNCRCKDGEQPPGNRKRRLHWPLTRPDFCNRSCAVQANIEAKGAHPAEVPKAGTHDGLRLQTPPARTISNGIKVKCRAPHGTVHAASVCRIPVDAGEDTSGGSIDLLVWSSSSLFEMGCPDGARPRSYSGGEVAASRRMYGAREQVTFVSRKAHRPVSAGASS